MDTEKTDSQVDRQTERCVDGSSPARFRQLIAPHKNEKKGKK
jgi:hypothetical protein